jgi:hypothetical protein
MGDQKAYFLELFERRENSVWFICSIKWENDDGATKKGG